MEPSVRFQDYRPRSLNARPHGNLKLQTMKEEKPKLMLNKRTIARLNNLEMTHVRGGDGDEGDPSRNKCGDEDDLKNKDNVNSDIQKVLNIFVSRLVGICQV